MFSKFSDLLRGLAAAILPIPRVLTATATQGFERAGLTSGEEIFHLLGNPGTTYTRGDAVTMANGVLAAVTDSGADLIGTVAETRICPAATQAAARPFEHDRIRPSANDLCWIPVKLNVSAGKQIYHCTFANHWDDTVISYASGTRSLAMTTGMTADDYPNGGIIYIYSGTGKGEVGIVEDYDHAGGNVELEIITHRVWAATPDSTSLVIVLGGEATGSGGIGFFGRLDAKDVNELDVSDGSNDGDYVVFMDGLQAADHLQNLRLPVIKYRDIFG